MAAELRAVLDTNVLLRIILSKKPEGVARALWDLLRMDHFRLVTSPPLLQELKQTLLVPELAELHGWSEAEVESYVVSIQELAVEVSGNLEVDLPPLQARDPSDLPFVAAALEGRAEFLVTQDPDLLSLGSVEAVQIIDPLDFLLTLRARAQA